jgi:hypothetical protein
VFQGGDRRFPRHQRGGKGSDPSLLAGRFHGSLIAGVGGDGGGGGQTIAFYLRNDANLDLYHLWSQEKLGVARGALSALAVMNDTAGDIQLALDQGLLDQVGTRI